jgi:hypothetical protein
MNDCIKLPLSFDVTRLQDDLSRLRADDWIDHFVEANYEGEWSVAPLRGPAGATHPVTMIYSDPTCTEFADTPLLERAGYLAEVLRSLRCPLHAARLMRLTPGSRIKEHMDLDLCAEEGAARLHIPIRTNEQVEFLLNGRPLKLEEGECWYLRLSDPHSVKNRGTEDRVHLVIDVVVNDWLRRTLESGSAP